MASVKEPSVSIYPSDLLEESKSPDADTDCRWWTVYTKSRQEKALARDLFAREVPFYLPMIRKSHLSRGRRITTVLPLFAGYVFAYGTDEDRVLALKTNRISRVLPVENGDELRRDLLQVERLIEANAPISLESRLSCGQEVRVTSGPFRGLEGTVLCRRGGDRLLIKVNYLQQGVSLEINDFSVELI